MSELSHLNARGEARMVDVGGKPVTARRAVAEGFVRMSPATLERILAGTLPKGDVIATARVAGIMGAKQTANLIPMCHPLGLDSVELDIAPLASRDGLRLVATCRVQGRTGIEMEALTAVSVAALTLYDMCKAVEKGMIIDGIRLLEKEGGRSGLWQAEERA